MIDRRGRLVLAILALTGCGRPASVLPEVWRLPAALVVAVVSTWLTHRFVDRFWKTPNADKPLIPWYLLLEPSAWTLARALLLFKFVAGFTWLAAWLWFFLG